MGDLATQYGNIPLAYAEPIRPTNSNLATQKSPMFREHMEMVNDAMVGVGRYQSTSPLSTGSSAFDPFPHFQETNTKMAAKEAEFLNREFPQTQDVEFNAPPSPILSEKSALNPRPPEGYKDLGLSLLPPAPMDLRSEDGTPMSSRPPSPPKKMTLTEVQQRQEYGAMENDVLADILFGLEMDLFNARLKRERPSGPINAPKGKIITRIIAAEKALASNTKYTVPK